MNFFIFLLVIVAILAGLTRYSVRFRTWRVVGYPVCWPILAIVGVVTFLLEWWFGGISYEMSAGLTVGSGFIGVVSGEIARELLTQVNRCTRWGARQLSRLVFAAVVVFVAVYVLQNPVVEGPMTLVIAAGGLAIILGWRPWGRRRH